MSMPLEGTVVYTDGSYDKKHKQCGYSAVILSDHTPGYLEVLYGGTSNPQVTPIWNIGGEILGVYHAISYLCELGYTEKPIHIYHDYTYLEGWANQTAKRNRPMTQWYSEQMERFRSMFGITLLFHHVKGHSGNYLNELADEYAKKGVGLAEEGTPYEVCKLPLPNFIALYSSTGQLL